MKEAIAVGVAGAFLSLGLWLSAMNVVLRTQAAAIRRLPEAWRSHPELREGYRLTAELRMRDLLKERRGLATWLGGLTLFAACLRLVDIPLGISLAAAVTYAAYSTADERTHAHTAMAKTRTELGLPKVERDRWLSVRYMASLLLLKVGFYLLPVFLGYLIASVAD